MKPTLYPPQNPRELEPHYSAHVAAMTTERLDGKAEIAEQLAWRDNRIADVAAYLEQTRENCSGLGHVQWSTREVMEMLGQVEALLAGRSVFPHPTTETSHKREPCRAYDVGTTHRCLLPGGHEGPCNVVRLRHG